MKKSYLDVSFLQKSTKFNFLPSVSGTYIWYVRSHIKPVNSSG